MSDAQILTIAFTMLAIFVASWFNNSRFGDTNTRIGDVNNRIGDVNKRIDDLSRQLDTRLDDFRDVIRAEIRLESERMIQKIDAVLNQLANHETRITRLEER